MPHIGWGSRPGPDDPARAAARVARQRMLRVTEAMDPTRQALEQHIARLEDALRFHDAAEGPQYFAEQATRELVQRELDKARASLARTPQDAPEPPPAPTLPPTTPDAL